MTAPVPRRGCRRVIEVVVFDAYGTLFDIAAPARRAAAEPGREALAAVWPQVARDWRLKQLQYSWIRAITGAHADFWQVTQDGLDWALEAAGLAGEPGLRARLLALYRELDAYPEVPATLGRLREQGLGTAILSNGTPGMLGAAVESAGLGELLDARAFGRGGRRLQAGGGGLRPGRRRVRHPARPGALRLVERLGRGRGGRVRLRYRLGEPRGGAGRPAALGAPPHPARPHPSPGARRHAMNRFTTEDGLSLAYLDEGAGLPLLCLPGLTRNAADFDELAAALAGRHRLIRLTLRGRGASDRDPDFRNYNVLVEARDVVGLLDHLGLERVVVVGTSRGGLIAMMLAATAKPRLAGVLLNDIGPELAPEGLANIMSYLGIAPRAKSFPEAAARAPGADGRAVPGARGREVGEPRRGAGSTPGRTGSCSTTTPASATRSRRSRKGRAATSGRSSTRSRACPWRWSAARTRTS